MFLKSIGNLLINICSGFVVFYFVFFERKLVSWEKVMIVVKFLGILFLMKNLVYSWLSGFGIIISIFLFFWVYFKVLYCNKIVFLVFGELIIIWSNGLFYVFNCLLFKNMNCFVKILGWIFLVGLFIILELCIFFLVSLVKFFLRKFCLLIVFDIFVSMFVVVLMVVFWFISMDINLEIVVIVFVFLLGGILRKCFFY